MRNDVVLQKMINHANSVLEYCEGYSYEDFLQDKKTVEASVFNIGQIGELTKKLEGSIKTKHTEVPWSDIYGVQCKIQHDYDGVNFLLVWQIIREDLPELISQLKIILQEL